MGSPCDRRDLHGKRFIWLRGLSRELEKAPLKVASLLMMKSCDVSRLFYERQGGDSGIDDCLWPGSLGLTDEQVVLRTEIPSVAFDGEPLSNLHVDLKQARLR